MARGSYGEREFKGATRICGGDVQGIEPVNNEPEFAPVTAASRDQVAGVAEQLVRYAAPIRRTCFFA
jgi:hypothetical protein